MRIFQTIVKNQFLCGSFSEPLILIAFGLYIGESSLVFLFQPAVFYLYYRRKDFHFYNLYCSGGPISSYIMAYNASWILWFNIWYIILTVISINKCESGIFICFLQYNLYLMVTIIVGNLIFNSSATLLVNKFFRRVIPYLIYSVSILIVGVLLLIIELYTREHELLLYLIILGVCVWFWIMSLKTFNYITHLESRLK